jgi:cell division protein FtsN
MRSLLETEEEVDERASEITLSTTSLLGIFFGLVLICGVFFGFGYSMGRGVGPSAQASSLEGSETEVAQKEPTLETSNRDSQATTSATEQGAAPSAPEHRSEPAHSASALPHQDTVKPAPLVVETPPQPMISKPSAARLVTVPSYTPPADAPPSAGGQPMVQIAAVARREDADVLVAALRQRGYGVVVRNEPQDNLLHVQVGPFANRGQAAAMKQKLLSDGYNAIIKQ